MRILDQYVVVEQVMVSKSRKIILDQAKNEKDKFEYSFKVLQKGNKCERDFKVGDSPIFSEHVHFAGLKILEKSNMGMISEIIVHENDIIGVEDDEETINKHTEMHKIISDSITKEVLN